MEGLMKTQKTSSRDRLAGKPLIGFKTPVRRAPNAMVGTAVETRVPRAPQAMVGVTAEVKPVS
jgi:hypothetical protein